MRVGESSKEGALLYSRMRTTMLALIVILALSIGSVNGICHPVCTWTIPTVSCFAVCTPVTLPPVCSVNCTNPAHITECATPRCHVSCPNATDQCAADSCPACETVCSPLHCTQTDCAIQCQETQASWSCAAPSRVACPPPKPVLTCSAPACETSGASTIVQRIPISTVCTTAALLVILWSML